MSDRHQGPLPDQDGSRRSGRIRAGAFDPQAAPLDIDTSDAGARRWGLPAPSVEGGDGPGLTRHETLHLVAAVWRWIAVFVTLAVAAAATVAAHDLADRAEPWNLLRRELHGDGYGILVFSLTGVIVGALMQTPSAVVRKGRIVLGWLTVAGILVHHLVFGLLAVPLAAITPDRLTGVQKDYVHASYSAGLISVLFALTVVAVVGGVFWRPAPSVGTRVMADRSKAAKKSLMDGPLGMMVLVSAPGWLLWLIAAFILLISMPFR